MCIRDSWKGDEKRKQMTRIYGVSFQKQKDLSAHLNMLEEAKKRDHRKIGKEMELFTFSQKVGQGLPLWLPKGAQLREKLENFLKKAQLNAGYVPVITPHIGNKDIYVCSGHYEKYGEDSFQPIKTPQENEEFFLKPMNCPHHCEIYKSKQYSYKDLPVRFAEFGTVYRYEQSGELHGWCRWFSFHAGALRGAGYGADRQLRSVSQCAISVAVCHALCLLGTAALVQLAASETLHGGRGGDPSRLHTGTDGTDGVSDRSLSRVHVADFDDALSFDILSNGYYEIGVHIADVSHYVQPDSILDEEAYDRATSVYLVDRVIPMLPEVLSNGACSLRPHEEKYTFSAVFTVNNKMQIEREWFGKTIILSNHRFSSEEAQYI